MPDLMAALEAASPPPSARAAASKAQAQGEGHEGEGLSRRPKRQGQERKPRPPRSRCRAAAVEVDVEGRRLRLSNLDKVLYPEAGFTKGQVIDYYTRVAPGLLPHLRGRALTLKRYPNGVEAGHFYEKQKPSHAPEWVQSRADPGRRPDDRLRALRRPAHPRLARQPRRPRAAPLAGAGRGPRRAHRARLRPRPGPPAGAGRVLRGGAAAARHARPARARVLPEDLGLEGHAGLRAAEHRGDLRRDQAVRARRWPGCSRRSTRSWSSR